MLGVFDSGLGGVRTATHIHNYMPENDMLILADEQYAPYGERDVSWIRERVFSCLHWLFDQGCVLVVLACNTASTAAIVERQTQYPEKKVLSITVPGVEYMVHAAYHHIAILATEISVMTNLYPRMFAKHFPYYAITIEHIIGHSLVRAIESGDSYQQEALLSTYIGLVPEDCEALVLGCTHYPLIADSIQKKLPSQTVLVDPGAYAASLLPMYLERHPIITQHLVSHPTGGRVYLATTQWSDHFQQTCQSMRNKDLIVSEVVI